MPEPKMRKGRTAPPQPLTNDDVLLGLVVEAVRRGLDPERGDVLAAAFRGVSKDRLRVAAPTLRKVVDEYDKVAVREGISQPMMMLKDDDSLTWPGLFAIIPPHRVVKEKAIPVQPPLEWGYTDTGQPTVRIYLKSETPYAAAKGGFAPGDTVTLYGSGFNPVKVKNEIVIRSGTGDFQTKNVVPAIKSGSGVVAFELPEILYFSKPYVIITNTDHPSKPSEPWQFSIVPPPPPPAPPSPKIIGLDPPHQFAGRTILINGVNLSGANYAASVPGIFNSPKPGITVHLQTIDGGDFWDFTWRPAESELASDIFDAYSFHDTALQPVSGTQLKLRLPVSLMPGQYRLRLSSSNAGWVTSWSDFVSFEVLPYRYVLNLLEIYCIDESNPEKVGFFQQDDEIIVVFVGGPSDGKSFAWNSSTYNFPEDAGHGAPAQAFKGAEQTQFPREGEGRVAQALWFVLQVKEVNDDDIKEAMQAIGIMADVAKVIISVYAKGDTAAGYKGIIDQIVGLVEKFLTLIFGDANDLGKRARAYDARQLQYLTNNDEKRITEVIPFMNNDDTGSYTVKYEILRFET